MACNPQMDSHHFTFAQNMPAAAARRAFGLGLLASLATETVASPRRALAQPVLALFGLLRHFVLTSFTPE
jgi:hypothetical protein